MDPILERIIIAVLLSLGISMIYTGLAIGVAVFYVLPPTDEEDN